MINSNNKSVSIVSMIEENTNTINIAGSATPLDPVANDASIILNPGANNPGIPLDPEANLDFDDNNATIILNADANMDQHNAKGDVNLEHDIITTTIGNLRANPNSMSSVTIQNGIQLTFSNIESPTIITALENSVMNITTSIHPDTGVIMHEGASINLTYFVRTDDEGNEDTGSYTHNNLDTQFTVSELMNLIGGAHEYP